MKILLLLLSFLLLFSLLMHKFVGIYISKKTFDAAIYSDVKGSRFSHEVFAQTEAGYTSFLSWLQDHDVLLQNAFFV